MQGKKDLGKKDLLALASMQMIEGSDPPKRVSGQPPQNACPAQKRPTIHGLSLAQAYLRLCQTGLLPSTPHIYPRTRRAPPPAGLLLVFFSCCGHCGATARAGRRAAISCRCMCVKRDLLKVQTRQKRPIISGKETYRFKLVIPAAMAAEDRRSPPGNNVNQTKGT